MKIEELIKIPSDFKKVSEDNFYIRHENYCEMTIETWKDKNGQITHRSKIDKKGNGWSFRRFQDIIWFCFVENGFLLCKEKIAICRFSEKKQKTMLSRSVTSENRRSHKRSARLQKKI